MTQHEAAAMSDVAIDTATWHSYQLFKEQKNRFVHALPPDTVPQWNWKELDPRHIRSRKNWFIGFIPTAWGVFKGSFGVHFTFAWYRDRKTGIEHVRFPVGVEMPLKKEFHVRFKDDVVAVLRERQIALPGCALWPNAGPRKAKLLEPTPVPLDDAAWEKVLNGYHGLGEFVQVVADVIRQYHARGCFAVNLEFPASQA